MADWQYGLLFDNADQFIGYYQDKLTTTLTEVHVHGTWEPSHADFTGSNHRELQDNMRDYHVNTNGWDDIAQHITIFPDGKIMTGRNINLAPASATGHNGTNEAHPFMFEMVGNFDVGNDKLDGAQLETAVKITRHFGRKGIPFHFHNEFTDLKTCPGSGVNYEVFKALVDGEWTIYKEYKNPGTYDSNASYHRPLFLQDPYLRGEDVKRIQTALGVSATGNFLTQTHSTLVAWQKANWTGSEPLGVVSQAIWNRLVGV